MPPPPAGVSFTTDPDAFFAAPWAVCVEAAGQDAVRAYGERCLPTPPPLSPTTPHRRHPRSRRVSPQTPFKYRFVGFDCVGFPCSLNESVEIHWPLSLTRLRLGWAWTSKFECRWEVTRRSPLPQSYAQ